MSKPYKDNGLFYNSLIIHGIIDQIVFWYFELYFFLLNIIIKIDLKICTENSQYFNK